MENWLQTTSKGVVLRLQIQPQAKKTEVVGPHGDRLKIRISAPPVDGKANEELLRFLKELLSVPLELIRGETARTKDVLCKDLTAEQIGLRLKTKKGDNR